MFVTYCTKDMRLYHIYMRFYYILYHFMKTLKYRINEILENLPARISQILKKELPIQLNISVNYFNKIRAYPIDSSYGASSDQLIQIAEHISIYRPCTVDDLLNKKENTEIEKFKLSNIDQSVFDIDPDYQKRTSPSINSSKH